MAYNSCLLHVFFLSEDSLQPPSSYPFLSSFFSLFLLRLVTIYSEFKTISIFFNDYCLFRLLASLVSWGLAIHLWFHISAATSLPCMMEAYWDPSSKLRVLTKTKWFDHLVRKETVDAHLPASLFWDERFGRICGWLMAAKLFNCASISDFAGNQQQYLMPLRLNIQLFLECIWRSKISQLP